MLIEKRIKELALPMLRYGSQLIADHQEMICPVCCSPLLVEEHERERTVNSVFGDVLIERSYGFCKTCEKYVYPADKALGLHELATASLRVQEISSLAVLKSPAGQISEDVKRMTGLDLTPITLHREARRQGERALCLREKDVELTNTVDGVKELCKRAQSSANDSGYTIVIEIDAWNIRERDNIGGLTEKYQKTVEREIGYFNRHANKMDYKNGRKLKQPLGSGAMESTCAQYQCRFKRTGQFWSLDGDEAFLALQTLHWNKRWHLLFAHDRQKE